MASTMKSAPANRRATQVTREKHHLLSDRAVTILLYAFVIGGLLLVLSIFGLLLQA